LTLSIAILALVTLQRVGELWLSQRNTRRLLAKGAVEHGRSHYKWIVAVHVAWLAALWVLTPGRPVSLPWLVVYLLVQVARVWVLATLGSRWTTRIITVPGETLVKRGPYRLVDHPNYLVVAAEIAVLPLVFGFWDLAIVFTMLNAAVLFIRIREENKALGRA
jgi:methyltransferase